MARWLMSEKAAEVLGVSRPTLIRLWKEGKLQALNLVNDEWPIFDEDYLLRVRDTVVPERAGRRKNTSLFEVEVSA